MKNKVLILSISVLGASTMGASPCYANFYSNAIKASCYGEGALAATKATVTSWGNTDLAINVAAHVTSDCLTIAKSNSDVYQEILNQIAGEFTENSTPKSEESANTALAAIEDLTRRMNSQFLNSKVLAKTFAPEVSQALKSAKEFVIRGQYEAMLEQLQAAQVKIEQTKQELI